MKFVIRLRIQTKYSVTRFSLCYFVSWIVQGKDEKPDLMLELLLSESNNRRSNLNIYFIQRDRTEFTFV